MKTTGIFSAVCTTKSYQSILDCGPKDTDMRNDLESFFFNPLAAKQRQYEALRAYVVDKAPAKAAAERFGFTEKSLYALAHDLNGRDFEVRIRKRAHTPILLGVKKLQDPIEVPWLDQRPLRIVYTS